MKNKRNLIIVLAVLLLVTLTACNKKDDSVVDNPSSSSSSAAAKDWPSEVPKEIPAYPDGKVEGDVTITDNGGTKHYYGFVVVETSKESFDKYTQILLDAGWRIEKQKNETNINFIKGNNDFVDIRMLSDESVDIFITFKE